MDWKPNWAGSIAAGVAGILLLLGTIYFAATFIAADWRAKDAAATQAFDDRPGIPDWMEGAIAAPAPRDATERDDRVLAAQESMASFAGWMLVVALLTAIVTAAGTIVLLAQIRLTRKALDETRRSNELTDKHAIMNLRPWLAFSPTDFTIFGNKPMTVYCRVENSGRSPAVRVRLLRNLYFGPGPGPALPLDFDDVSQSIGAGQVIDEPFEYRRVFDEMDYIAVMDGSAIIRLRAAIFYEDQFGNEYETHFSAQLDPHRSAFLVDGGRNDMT
ncbi:hypothetical protein VCJ71_12095 [Alteriqipengyuania sp. WL0013]|uniref:hypothetical protein n=1 Tax=Alteriqipengyuania sp. WL0013 TaxID=3110773 RepID=UPI002C4E16C8|nr:hypothetical protein [Alteriqipengyuania sp. WL0013]MEB3416804.1 hypothetical protein [Alteriqipengyuania sp. WL0013]